MASSIAAKPVVEEKSDEQLLDEASQAAEDAQEAHEARDRELSQLLASTRYADGAQCVCLSYSPARHAIFCCVCALVFRERSTAF
jgi:hypothetical protein